jgi:S1-C subfamily serine protease
MMRNGKLVGAAISQSGSNVYALPVSLIKRFVRESLSDDYRAFPELGISFSNLLSPALRKYGKAEDYDNGVWIQDIKETSAFAKVLKKGDILYEINSVPVSARGSYDHPLWGRISITALLSEIYAGDKVELKVLRDGKDEVLTANIGPYNPDLDTFCHR